MAIMASAVFAVGGRQELEWLRDLGFMLISDVCVLGICVELKTVTHLKQHGNHVEKSVAAPKE